MAKIKLINDGFLEEKPRVSDYMFGSASNLPFVDRVLDGNWNEYLPIGEKQNIGFETMACVSFSCNNSIETQLNWMLRHNRMKDNAKKFLYDNGYIVDNKVNLSDRFLAIMSNTTKQGNWFTVVADTIRKIGFIPESMFPFGGSSFEEYHDKTKITDAMLAMAKESLKYFDIQYEWVSVVGDGKTQEQARADSLRSLRHAPNWIGQHGHATKLFLGVDKKKWGQFESYIPYERELKWNELVGSVMKIVIDNKPDYSLSEIMEAKKEVLKIMKGRPSSYFWRPKSGDASANGEAYKSYIDGSFKYFLGKECPLFNEMIADKTLTPISAEHWNKIKAAEIK